VAYRVGYARGFRTPSINEQYFYLPGYSANHALGYAKSDVWEGGLRLHRQRMSLDTTLSYGLHRGIIGIQEPFSATDPQRPVNTAGARIWAFEVEARGDLSLDDMVFASYTFQHSVDRTTGESVPGVPDHLVSLGSSIRFASRFTLTPTLVVRASRPRSPDDARDAIPASAVVSVSLRGIRLWRALEATLRLQDLFDSAPVDPAKPWGVPGDYPSAGRSVLLGASYRF
jgi:outer membrane receptor protein involved in Fe transport